VVGFLFYFFIFNVLFFMFHCLCNLLSVSFFIFDHRRKNASSETASSYVLPSSYSDVHVLLIALSPLPSPPQAGSLGENKIRKLQKG
jgi:hypothetical protein